VIHRHAVIHGHFLLLLGQGCDNTKRVI
jgi:hypothetical protein